MRLGSITRAAQELHLTQPTVSAQIHELRTALETVLVEPAGRGIRPIEAARMLRATALDMFARWQRFEDERQALHGLQRGVLRIAGATTTEYFIAQWLQRYTTEHPGIDIELAVDNRDAVVRRLREETIERRWMLVWRRDRRLSLAAQRFVEHMRASAVPPAGGAAVQTG